jgi:hypothetical protein
MHCYIAHISRKTGGMTKYCDGMDAVPASYLGGHKVKPSPETGILTEDFLCFPQLLQEIARTEPEIGLWLLRFTFFPMHCSLITLSFDAV